VATAGGLRVMELTMETHNVEKMLTLEQQEQAYKELQDWAVKWTKESHVAETIFIMLVTIARQAKTTCKKHRFGFEEAYKATIQIFAEAFDSVWHDERDKDTN
jgi:uncharacterized RmlC-like cupin family protein